jgi:hypothetical protein
MLRERIEALTAALAADFVRAARDEARRELARVPRTKTKAKAETKNEAKTEAKSKAETRTKTSVPQRPHDDEAAMRVVADFFGERGSKGATVAQVAEHVSAERAPAIVAALAARGTIRDTGMRRATGKGTAAVFVLSRAPAKTSA